MLQSALLLLRKATSGTVIALATLILVAGNYTVPMSAGTRFAMERPGGSLVVFCTKNGLHRNAFVMRHGKPRYEPVHIGPVTFGGRKGVPVVLLCPASVIKTRLAKRDEKRS